MSNYPDNFSDSAFNAKYEAPQPDEATADEIERQIALDAMNITTDFLSDKRDRYGRNDLPKHEDFQIALRQFLEDQMYHRLQAARKAWGE